MAERSLKQIWNIQKYTKNIVQTSFKYPWIISKTFLKHLFQNYNLNDLFSAYWILDVALYEVDTFVGSFVYDAIEHVRKSKNPIFHFFISCIIALMNVSSFVVYSRDSNVAIRETSQKHKTKQN